MMHRLLNPIQYAGLAILLATSDPRKAQDDHQKEKTKHD